MICSLDVKEFLHTERTKSCLQHRLVSFYHNPKPADDFHDIWILGRIEKLTLVTSEFFDLSREPFLNVCLFSCTISINLKLAFLHHPHYSP